MDPFEALVRDRPVPTTSEYKKKLKQLKKEKFAEMRQKSENEEKVIRTNVTPDEIPPQPIKIETVELKWVTEKKNEQLISRRKEFYEALFQACCELHLIDNKKRPETITENMANSYIQKIRKYYVGLQDDEEPKVLNRSTLHCFVDALYDPKIALTVSDFLKDILGNRNLDMIVDLGIVSVIVDLLSNGDSKLEEPLVQLLLTIMGNITKNDFARGFRIIETKGLLPTVYRILEQGSRKAKLDICYGLEELATIEGVSPELIKSLSFI